MSKVTGLVAVLLVVVLAAAFAAFYVLNVIELVGSPVIGIEEVLQIIGVFIAPLGALMGVLTL